MYTVHTCIYRTVHTVKCSDLKVNVSATTRLALKGTYVCEEFTRRVRN